MFFALWTKSNLHVLAFELRAVSPNPVFLLTPFLSHLLLPYYNYLLHSHVFPLIFTQLFFCALWRTYVQNKINRINSRLKSQPLSSSRHKDLLIYFSLVLLFSCSAVSDSLWPHGLQHTRLPCPSPSPVICSHIESVIPSNHLILFHPVLLLPSILPSIRFFSNISKAQWTPSRSDFLLLFNCSVVVQLFATPWTAAWQASLSFTIFWSLLKLKSIESVMPFNYLTPFSLCPQSFLASRSFSVVGF